MRQLTFFLLFFYRFSLRNMKKHPWRVLSVLVGIAMGAAVFTSVRLANHASLVSFENSMNLITGTADLVATSPGAKVPETLVASLLSHPEVQTAAPVLSAYVNAAGQAAAPFLLIGLDPLLDRDLRQWQAADSGQGQAWLDLLRTPFSLLMTRPLADELDLAPGGGLVLEHAQQRTGFTLRERLDAHGLAMAEGGRLAITDIATFQEFTGLFGMVDRIDIVLAPAAGPGAPDQLKLLLPEGVDLVSPSASRESGRFMLRAYQINLSVLSFASLFVGMFLTYSLVALNATARRRELAILRSLGGSPRLLLGLFVAEGLFLGTAGWIAAVPVGSLLVKFMVAGISRTVTNLFVRVQVDRLTLSIGELALSLGITIIVSGMAALVPAIQATRVMPGDIFSKTGAAAAPRRQTRRLALAGLLLVLMVWPLSRLPGIDGIPLPGYLAVVCLLIGFSLLAPWGLRQTGRRMARIIRRTGNPPAELACRYIRDSGTRTAVSVGALITAIALFTALVIMIHSFRNTVELWVAQTVSGDLFIAPKLGEINRNRDVLTPATIEYLKTLKPRADLLPVRQVHLLDGKFQYQIEGMDLAAFRRHGRFFWVRGNDKESFPELVAGRGVLVSEVYAARTGLDVGDRFRARIHSALLDLPILGIVRDYRTRGGVVFISLTYLNAKTAPESTWTGARLYLKDPATDPAAAAAELRQQILRHSRDTLTVILGTSLRGSILNIFDDTFAVTFVLLLIALLVATLGIATTLTVLVLERARQLNTLAAVGAGPGQIRAMILWESLIIVTAGETMGVGCGFLLSYLLVYVINYQSFGWSFLYRVDWSLLGFSVPLIIGTAFLSAMPAVRLAFGLPPAQLLRDNG